MLTVQQLQDFESRVAKIYESGVIRGPIHLSDGNEQQLIEIFSKVRKQDWVFSTWRSHYHALLKGVPADQLLGEISEGRSITLQFPDHRFYSSAIVGGDCPIALGAAWSIKNKKLDERVYCFVGDMAAHCGIFNECVRYSIGHDLPITWIIEDNGKSVGTPTEKCTRLTIGDIHDSFFMFLPKSSNVKIISYRYNLSLPHSGIGKFVEF